jgi:hypothetical protein
MIPVMQELLALDSPEEMYREFGYYLGLGGPVSQTVFRRAQQDNRFALHLVMSRGNDRLLRLHLDDPRNHQYRTDGNEKAISNLKLAGRLGAALYRWGREGFRTLDEAVIKTRLDMCQSCPNLIEPPNKLIYKVKLVKASDPRICQKCGCVASAKVKVPTERCPIGLWGEI